MKPSDQIGPCLLIGPLGSGAMGTVYRAKHLRLDVEVAIKVLPKAEGADATKRLERFRREGQAAARVQHENVARVLDLGLEPVPYLVQELVDGQDLRSRVSGAGLLSPEEVARVGLQLTQGLLAIHAAGLVHRDIKPDNVVFGIDGVLRIVDFGVVRFATGKETLSARGSMIGTPQFMAPEQFSGVSERMGPHVDAFSLGAVLHFALIGRAPHERAEDSLLGLLARRSSEPAPDVRVERPDVPAYLAEVIRDLLRTEVDERASLDDVLARLVDQRVEGESEEGDDESEGPARVALGIGLAVWLLVMLVGGAIISRSRTRLGEEGARVAASQTQSARPDAVAAASPVSHPTQDHPDATPRATPTPTATATGSPAGAADTKPSPSEAPEPTETQPVTGPPVETPLPVEPSPLASPPADTPKRPPAETLSAEARLAEALTRRVNLDVRDTELSAVVAFLQDLTNANLAYDPALARRKVTIRIDGLTLRSTLGLLAKRVGLRSSSTLYGVGSICSPKQFDELRRPALRYPNREVDTRLVAKAVQVPVSVNFKATPFAEALSTLSKISRVKLVLSAKAAKHVRATGLRVSLRLKDVSLGTALLFMTVMNDMVHQVQDDVVMIEPAPTPTSRRTPPAKVPARPGKVLIQSKPDRVYTPDLPYPYTWSKRDPRSSRTQCMAWLNDKTLLLNTRDGLAGVTVAGDRLGIEAQKPELTCGDALIASGGWLSVLRDQNLSSVRPTLRGDRLSIPPMGGPFIRGVAVHGAQDKGEGAKSLVLSFNGQLVVFHAHSFGGSRANIPSELGDQPRLAQSLPGDLRAWAWGLGYLMQSSRKRGSRPRLVKVSEQNAEFLIQVSSSLLIWIEAKGKVKRVDLDDGCSVRKGTRLSPEVWAVHAVAGANKVAVQLAKGRISLRDAETLAEEVSIRLPKGCSVLGMSASPSGEALWVWTEKGLLLYRLSGE